MATGLVHYTVSAADVQTLENTIYKSRRAYAGIVRSAPKGSDLTAGVEYPAMVVRSPVPEAPGDATHADLLVFVDGAQPYFVRDVVQGAGTAGTFNAVAQRTAVG